jgi:vacuolar-type H+-ATPase subunit I/STV1
MQWSELCAFVQARWQEQLEPDAAPETRAQSADTATSRTEAARLSERLRAADEELQRLNGECDSHRLLLEEHKIAAEKQTAVINDLFREIERLNGIVNAVHQSRLWKLRESLDRLTGRR